MASDRPKIPTVLVVDDEPEVLDAYREILSPRHDRASYPTELFGSSDRGPKGGKGTPGFDVLTARQGREAVELLRSHKKKGIPIQVAFLDIRMPPGIDGLETAKRLRKIDPNLQIVIATAFADYPFYEIAKHLGKREALFYLEKPFTADQVRQLAHSLVQQWATRHELEFTLEQFMRLAEQRFKDHNARGEVGAGLRETLLMVEDLTGTKSLALIRQTPRGGFEHVAGTGLLESQRDLNRARQKRIALALFELEVGEGEEVPPGPGGASGVWAVVMMEPTQSRETCLAAVRAIRPYLPHAAEQLDSRAENADAGTPLTTGAGPEETALANVGGAEAQSATDPLTNFHGILTGDPAMLVLFEQIRRVARQDVPVFITGETGSGKEMAAKALHSEGRRNGKPFVALNCANLTEPLLESQLFGHRKGAFTGAIADQRGLLAEAEGGILFLDEVTEIPLALQAKLLRVLQEREYTPLGSTRPISFDILIVSAAQTALREAVEAGRFRPDLQYRLQVIPLVLPPLRARSDDRVLLFDRFLRSAFKAQRGETPIPKVSPEVWQVIRHYQWPGNVRELQNVCAYLVAMTSGPEITVEFLPEDLRMSLLSQIQEGLGGGVAPVAAAQLETAPQVPDSVRPRNRLGAAPLDEARDLIREALNQSKGNRSEAARQLGVSRMTLWRRMRALGMDPP